LKGIIPRTSIHATPVQFNSILPPIIIKFYFCPRI
jgi:hypothetical protein